MMGGHGHSEYYTALGEQRVVVRLERVSFFPLQVALPLLCLAQLVGGAARGHGHLGAVDAARGRLQRLGDTARVLVLLGLVGDQLLGQCGVDALAAWDFIQKHALLSSAPSRTRSTRPRTLRC